MSSTGGGGGGSGETIVLLTGIAATLQLCRWAMDLISTASQRDAEKDKKLEQASREELRARLLKEKSKKRDVKNGSVLRSSFFSKKFQRDDNDEEEKSKKAIDYTAATETAVANGKDVTTKDKQQSNNNISNAESEEQEVFTAAPLTAVETRLGTLSFMVNLCWCVFFSILCILSALVEMNTAVDSLKEISGMTFQDPVALGCTAVFFGLALWTYVRDRTRVRFTTFQRGFHMTASLMLALTVIIWVSLNYNNSISALDVVSMILTGLYAIMAVLECRIIRLPDVLLAGNPNHKKTRLSWKAFLTVLKPYFWPTATSSSATLNRIRALATWGFVVASKAAGLLAPVYIGRASTALTQGRYDECIRNVIWFSLLTLASAICKEGQSLVYLRVAQAAFVQLAELSFRHLHSLSLDWHLQKKLGEVIRSMDRGILACDTLVKYLFLWLIPAIAECILVVIIFATYFNYLPLAVTVFYFVFAYMLLTVLLTLWRKKFRKQVTKSDNDWHDIATDSLVNFETVKYFTSEDREMEKFGVAVKAFQKGGVNVAASLSMLNISQRILLQSCLAAALILSVLAIQDRLECCEANGCSDASTQQSLSECCSELESNICPGMEIGDFVAVLTYTVNLFTPLTFLGTVYNALVSK